MTEETAGGYASGGTGLDPGTEAKDSKPNQGPGTDPEAPRVLRGMGLKSLLAWEPLPWVVEGLLREGGVMAVSGIHDGRLDWFSTLLGFAIQNGIEFAGLFTHAREVRFVETRFEDFEAQRFAAVLKHALLGPGVPKCPIRYKVDRSDPEWMKGVISHAAEAGAKVVVVNSVFWFCVNAKFRSVLEAFEYLAETAKQTGVAIVGTCGAFEPGEKARVRHVVESFIDVGEISPVDRRSRFVARACGREIRSSFIVPNLDGLERAK
jgi:hypothetical protein